MGDGGVVRATTESLVSEFLSLKVLFPFVNAERMALGNFNAGASISPTWFSVFTDASALPGRDVFIGASALLA